MSDIDTIKVEYEVVDKNKSKAKAASETQRLEKRIRALNKAVASGKTTSEMAAAKMIEYGRSLKQITGMDGRAAFGAVTKFNNALTEQARKLKVLKLEADAATKAKNDMAVAEKQAAIAVAKNTAELRRLRMATDATYNADQKRLVMKKMLRMEMDKNGMKTEEAIKILNRYNETLKRGANAQRIMGGAAGNTRNRMNGANMALQQVGYQFGDFAVQVQGGTSAFTAFSQQGAQLAGILPMIAAPLGLSMGKAVALSAALGILIPIGSAVARLFFDMKDSAEDAADGQEELADKVKGVIKTVLAANEAFRDFNEGLANGVGDAQRDIKGVTESVEELYNQIQDLRNSETINPLVDTAKMILHQMALTKLVDEHAAAEARLQKLKDANAERSDQLASDAMVTSLQEMAVLQKKIDFGEDSVEVRELENIQAQKQYEIDLKDEGIVGIKAAQLLAMLVTQQELTQELKEQAKITADKNTAEELLSDLQSQLSVQLAINLAGKDSALAQNAVAEAARKTFENTVDVLEVAEPIKDAIMNSYDALQVSKSATVEWAAAMSNVAINTSAVTQAIANLASGEDSIASLEAQTAAILENGNVRAGQVAGMRAALAVSNAEVLALAQSKQGTEGNSDAVSIANDLIAASVEQLERRIIAQDENTAAQKLVTDSTKGGTAASNAAAKALEQEIKQREKLIKTLNDAVDPLSVYKEGIAELDALFATGDLSAKAYNKAVDDLNEGLIKSSPAIEGVSDAFSDFMDRGFKDFNQFTDDILDGFKKLLLEMAATALRNKIIIPMMTGAPSASQSTVGQAGSLASAAGGLSAATAAGGSLVGVSGFMGGVGSGVGMAASSIGAGGVGLGTTIAAQTSAATAAGASMASIGAAAGAILLPLAAVTAAVLFFKKKTTELDAGLRITAEGTKVLVDDFKKIKTSKFFGLSKKVTKEFKAMDDAVSGPLRKSIGELFTNVADTASTLGVAASAFDKFTSSVVISTKGMSPEAAQQAVLEGIIGIGNEFAEMVPDLEKVRREGESAQVTLSALAGVFSTVNSVFSDLGGPSLEASIMNAGHLRNVLETVFGTVDQFLAVSNSYYSNYFSEIEQASNLTDKLTSSFIELGLTLPKTMQGLRDLIEQAQATGQNELAMRLIALAPSVTNLSGKKTSIAEKAANDNRTSLELAINTLDTNNQVATAARDLAIAESTTVLEAVFEHEMQLTRNRFGVIIEELGTKLTGAEERLELSRSISEALTSALSSRLFPSAKDEKAAVDEASVYLKSLVGSGRINDEQAFRDALKIVEKPSTDTYETLEDYRRDFNRNSVVIRDLEGAAKGILSTDQVLVMKLEDQIAQAELSLETELLAFEDQLNALKGIDTKLGQSLTLLEAIALFNDAKDIKVPLNAADTITELQKIFQEELGRDIDKTGQDYFTKAIADGATIEDARNDISNSPEAKIQDIYNDLLGRQADQEGLDFFVNAANQGGSIEQIRKDIAASQEAAAFNTQAVVPAEVQQVQQVQQTQAVAQVMQTGPSQAAIAAAAQAASQAAQLAAQAASQASAQAAVQAAAQAAAQAVQATVSVALGPIEQIYADLLGRKADAGGLAFFRQGLSGGESIDNIRRDIAASQEAQAFNSYAGGGYTGDGVRAGGLDGQGGFMAMLHPQEDVIDRTKSPKAETSENPNIALTSEIRELRMENREMLMAISKNTKRSLDIERKHDIIGTPPVRPA